VTELEKVMQVMLPPEYAIYVDKEQEVHYITIQVINLLFTTSTGFSSPAIRMVFLFEQTTSRIRSFIPSRMLISYG